MKKSSDDLFLILKTGWYNLIEDLIKPEEYRVQSLYWEKRLCISAVAKEIMGQYIYRYQFKPFKTVTFQLGYAKDARRMTFEFKGIEVREGNPEWGAEADTQYFVIILGNRIFKPETFISEMSKKGYKNGSVVHYAPKFQPEHDTLPGNFELSPCGKYINSYFFPKEQRNIFDRQGFFTVYNPIDGWVKLIT